MGVDLKYLIAKWLFALGLGLLVLALVGARRPSVASSGERPGAVALPAALIVALAAPFVGFFLYRVNHPAFFSLCYAPWPLYCLVRLAQAETRRGIAASLAGLIVANVALMNSGTVKEAYMLLVSVNFSGACVLLASPLPWLTRCRRLAALAGAGVIFALLTAPIWATFLQTLKGAYTGYNAVSAYQIQPTLLLGAFDEIFYRPLMEGNRVFSPSLNFLLLLGVLYFRRDPARAVREPSRSPRSRRVRWCRWRWRSGSCRPLGSRRCRSSATSRTSTILSPARSSSCGRCSRASGFATAARRLGTRDGRADLMIAGLLLFALVFGWIAFRQAAHRPDHGTDLHGARAGQDPRDRSVHLEIPRGAIGRLGRPRLRSCGARWCATRLASRGAMLITRLPRARWSGRHRACTRRRSASRTSPPGPTVRTNFHARSGADRVRARRACARTGPRLRLQRQLLSRVGLGPTGLETDPRPRRARESRGCANSWVFQGVERIWDWRIYVEAPNVAAARPFLDALNVRYYFDLLSKHPGARLVAHARARRRSRRVAEPDGVAARVLHRSPRRLRPAGRPRRKIRAAEGRPFAAVQRSDREVAAARAALPRDNASRTITPATNYRLTENTTRFTVRASGPGMIVLTEAFWPGDFRAELNGRKAQILRVNHAFKGVRVDAAGDYAVVFRHVPRNWPRHLAFGAVGAAGFAWLLWLALRPARRA